MKVQDEGRSKVRELLTPSTAQLALKRILPFPCKKQYTVVILMPQTSRVKLLTSLFKSTDNSYSRKAKVSHSCSCSVLYGVCGDMASFLIFSTGTKPLPKFSKPNTLIFLVVADFSWCCWPNSFCPHFVEIFSENSQILEETGLTEAHSWKSRDSQ